MNGTKNPITDMFSVFSSQKCIHLTNVQLNKNVDYSRFFHRLAHQPAFFMRSEKDELGKNTGLCI